MNILMIKDIYQARWSLSTKEQSKETKEHLLKIIKNPRVSLVNYLQVINCEHVEEAYKAWIPN